MGETHDHQQAASRPSACMCISRAHSHHVGWTLSGLCGANLPSIWTLGNRIVSCVRAYVSVSSSYFVSTVVLQRCGGSGHISFIIFTFAGNGWRFSSRFLCSKWVDIGIKKKVSCFWKIFLQNCPAPNETFKLILFL